MFRLGGMEEEEDVEEAPPKLEPEVDPSEPSMVPEMSIPPKEDLIRQELTPPKSTILHIKKVNGTIVEVAIEGFGWFYIFYLP